MGSKKEKASCSVSAVFFLLGVAFLAIAIVFSVMFLGPETSDAMRYLKTGMQSSCQSNNKGLLFKTRVNVVNKTMEGLNLTTYVFNKRPLRASFEDKVNIVFSGEKKLVFVQPMVEGATIMYSIDVDTPTKLLYRSWAKRSTSSAYQKNNLQQFSDVINVKRTFPDAEFRFTARKPIHGTFNLTARVPQWYIVPEEAIDTCRDYPCEWKYSNYNWTKSSLWFITVNEGSATAHVDAKNYYKFVFSIPYSFCCLFFFHFLWMWGFLDSPSVWVTVTVLLYFFFIVCFVIGILISCRSGC